MSNLFFNDENINASIKKHLEATLSEYKNIKYAYAIMNKRNPANFSIISNRTEWFEFYIKNNYQFIDPVLITASHRITPFTWDKDLKIGSGSSCRKYLIWARITM